MARPSTNVKFSFESRFSQGIDSRLVIIGVALKYNAKIFSTDQRGQVIDYEEKNAGSTVWFPSYLDLLADRFAGYSSLRDPIFRSMPQMSPETCIWVTREIIQYLRQLAYSREDLSRGIVVTALAEIEEVKVESADEDEEEVETEFVDYDGGDEPSMPPGGLSPGQINRLRIERFRGAAETVCSVCLEEFSPEVEITLLPCSHTFHHRCIAVWLEKRASCPLCRLNITDDTLGASSATS